MAKIERQDLDEIHPEIINQLCFFGPFNGENLNCDLALWLFLLGPDCYRPSSFAILKQHRQITLKLANFHNLALFFSFLISCLIVFQLSPCFYVNWLDTTICFFFSSLFFFNEYTYKLSWWVSVFPILHYHLVVIFSFISYGNQTKNNFWDQSQLEWNSFYMGYYTYR